MDGPITPGMQSWLDEEVNASQRTWREYLNGLADYEREVLADPRAWAPVILDGLRADAERARRKVIGSWGVDPAREDQQPGASRCVASTAEVGRFLEALWAYEIPRETLGWIEANVSRLPEERRALEVCESYLASLYAVPALGAVLTESLAEIFGTRSAQQAASEALAVSLAGYFACRISLNLNRRLRFLLSLEGGSPFQNLLRHLPLEALGVWDVADPLDQRMDALAKDAAKAVEEHLKRERVTSRETGVADGSDEAADEDFGELGIFRAREAAREDAAAEKVARYRAARQRVKLSRQQSEALDLRERGLQVKEVAAQMECDPNTVKTHLKRARDKILGEMGREPQRP